MSNKYVNKVVLNGVTRLDLSGDTVTADKLLQGYTAHDKTGAPITGTLSASGGGSVPLKGTATYMDSSVIVSGDIDFGALVSADTEFYIVCADEDFPARTTGDVLFGHYINGQMYLEYYEGNDMFAYVQTDVTADNGTLQCNNMASATFANGEYTVLYAGASPLPSSITAGDTPVIANNTTVSASRAAAVGSTGLTLSITRAGRYRIKAAATNPYSTSESFGYKALARIYVNGTARGTLHTIAAYTTIIISEDLNLNAGDTVEIYASSANTPYKVSVSCLQACIYWNNGF